MNQKKGGGIRLLAVKLILGAVAAAVGMALMRVFGGAEFLVAVLIGIVPGVAERSAKKTILGGVLGLIGYFVGASVGTAVAKTPPGQGVPFGHWAVTGGFIGLTSGISSRGDRWFSPRSSAALLGAICGFMLGCLLGFLGDIGGFLVVFEVSTLPLYYYMREISLICAGIFINLGVAGGSALEARLDRKAQNNRDAEGAGEKAA